MHIFLWGADMDPTYVRERYPDARFEARARLGERWGILLRVPAGAHLPTADEHDVVTDDGRTLRALALTTEQTAGEPDAIWAAARYWELSTAAVDRLTGSAPPAVERV